MPWPNTSARWSACCEAFGFDVVLVETVGAGQGDTAVRDLADVLVLLLQPETGDDLQWEKAGLLEVADVVVDPQGRPAGGGARRGPGAGHAEPVGGQGAAGPARQRPHRGGRGGTVGGDRGLPAAARRSGRRRRTVAARPGHVGRAVRGGGGRRRR